MVKTLDVRYKGYFIGISPIPLMDHKYVLLMAHDQSLITGSLNLVTNNIITL